jgi:Rad3-related DNA helicase
MIYLDSVIVKVPFPNRGDRWTEQKRIRDQGWYDWQTALSLVQAYGRSIRSKDDWAHTFVLDSIFKSFVQKNRTRLPKWFIEAIRLR